MEEFTSYLNRCKNDLQNIGIKTCKYQCTVCSFFTKMATFLLISFLSCHFWSLSFTSSQFSSTCLLVALALPLASAFCPSGMLPSSRHADGGHKTPIPSLRSSHASRGRLGLVTMGAKGGPTGKPPAFKGFGGLPEALKTRLPESSDEECACWCVCRKHSFQGCWHIDHAPQPNPTTYDQDCDTAELYGMDEPQSRYFLDMSPFLANPLLTLCGAQLRKELQGLLREVPPGGRVANQAS